MSGVVERLSVSRLDQRDNSAVGSNGAVVVSEWRRDDDKNHEVSSRHPCSDCDAPANSSSYSFGLRSSGCSSNQTRRGFLRKAIAPMLTENSR